MEETHFAYLAGILDGEGYFACSTRSNAFGLTVAVIDEPLVAWLAETFPGTNRYRRGVTKAGNQIYVWSAERQDIVLELLRGVMPYLVIKRAQAIAMRDLILHLQTIPRYEIPTRKIAARNPIRAERRERRQRWKERADELRLAVAAARRK